MNLMKKIKLKPSKDGMHIPNPKTGRALHKDGEMVTLDKFWRRRIKAGEVEEVKEVKPKKPTKKKIKEPIIEEKGE